MAISRGDSRTLPSIRRDFARWRSRRSRGERIPSELWSAATALAHEHGVSMTARELGLGYYALKKRAALSTAAVPAVTLAPVPPLGFVEVPLATKGSGAACTLDLEDRRGTHLRVKLEGSSTESAEAIACALWSAR